MLARRKLGTGQFTCHLWPGSRAPGPNTQQTRDQGRTGPASINTARHKYLIERKLTNSKGQEQTSKAGLEQKQTPSNSEVQVKADLTNGLRTKLYEKKVFMKWIM